MSANTNTELAKSIKTDFKRMAQIANGLIAVAIEKDAAYGSSWCSRGGQGAFFQGVVRKWDRLETQLAKVGYDMFDMTVAEDTTESLDETLRDLVNYSLLVLEKREALRAVASRRARIDTASTILDRVADCTPMCDHEEPESEGAVALPAYVDQARDDPLPMHYAIGITDPSEKSRDQRDNASVQRSKADVHEATTRGPVPDIA